MQFLITEYKMARSIQQIKQDLEIIEAKTLEAGGELQDLYKSYLDSLSASAKQQLILASYQICTQFYPESFLDLSLSQKQNLQQKLRESGNELQPQLLSSHEQTELIAERNDLSFVAEMIKNLPLAQNNQGEDEETEVDESEFDLEIIKTELAELEISQLKAAMDNDATANPNDSPTQEIDFKNPEHLIAWHRQVEKAIKKALDHASKDVNKLLQESGIIPNRLPTKIMEIAIKAEESSSSRANNRKVKNIPNILNIVIETEKDKKSSSASIAQINLLRLRLLEIEFADPLLSAKRNQIRVMVNKIKELKHQYRAKKQEYTVAEAEAAWRSSWYED